MLLGFLHKSNLNSDYSLKSNQISSLTTLFYKQSITHYVSARKHKGTVDNVLFPAPDVQKTTIQRDKLNIIVSNSPTAFYFAVAMLMLVLALLINNVSCIISLKIFSFSKFPTFCEYKTLLA